MKSRLGTSPNGVLLVFVAFAFGFLCATDAVLVRSESFWSYCRRDSAKVSWGELPDRRTDAVAALAFEAEWRSVPPRTPVVAFLGSSVVEADIDVRQMGRRLHVAESDVVRLWLPASSAVEVGAVVPPLLERRPRAIVYLATASILLDGYDWAKLRLWDRRFVSSILGPRRLLATRSIQAGHLLGSAHVVIRHRQALRLLLFPWLYDDTTRAERGSARVVRNREAMRRAMRSGLSCRSLPMRALEQMARHARRAGVPFGVVHTPTRSRLALRPTVDLRVHACLSELAENTKAMLLPLRRLPEITEADFDDRMHMTELGAHRFTNAVASFIHELAPARRGRRR